MGRGSHSDGVDGRDGSISDAYRLERHTHECKALPAYMKPLFESYLGPSRGNQLSSEEGLYLKSSVFVKIQAFASGTEIVKVVQ